MENVTKRRDRHDIIAEILGAAVHTNLKTRIMYKARLSYYQISAYLDWLVKKGFLENVTTKQKRQNSIMYRTTQKGMDLLHSVKSVNKLLE